MCLVGCGLWTLGSVGGHLAERAMSQGGSRWLRLEGPDAIAGLSVLGLIGLIVTFVLRK